LGAGGPRFKSGRPDQNIFCVFFSLLKAPFAQNSSVEEVPTLVMHGDDDQVVPIKDAGLLSAKIIKNAKLKVYSGYPHGMLTIHADVLNPDILEFIRS
jgi:pimeloyl-ACP methyl ester carboxylesterase